MKKGHHKGGNKNSQDANRQGNAERLMEEEIYEYVVPVTSNRIRDCRANFNLFSPPFWTTTYFMLISLLITNVVEGPGLLVFITIAR